MATLGGEIALAPARMLLRPGLLEPSDGRGRKPASVLAEQRDQCLIEVARRDPSGRGSGSALRGSSIDARTAAESPRKNECDRKPWPTRSRTRGHRTATGPTPVMILRSGRCPWRTSLIPLRRHQLSPVARWRGRRPTGADFPTLVRGNQSERRWQEARSAALRAASRSRLSASRTDRAVGWPLRRSGSFS